MAPFFTIITSTYNAASTLPRLLDSLTFQTCKEFNWIVQDGASTDDTMRIVERYRDRLPEILADSGKDSGIYDAWNTALNRWRDKLGEWVLFLGADDMLADKHVLNQARNLLQDCSEKIIFGVGELIFFDPDLGFAEHSPQQYSAINFERRFFGMPFQHPALFNKKSIFKQRNFDISFKIAGDYDFILRTWKSPEQVYPLNITVTKMAIGGISSSSQTKKKCQSEKCRAIKKNLPFDWKHGLRYVVILADAYFFNIKMELKNKFYLSEGGKAFWGKLQKLRRYIIK